MLIMVILYLSFSLHVIVLHIMRNYFEHNSATKESRVMFEKKKKKNTGDKKCKSELIPGLNLKERTCKTVLPIQFSSATPDPFFLHY